MKGDSTVSGQNVEPAARAVLWDLDGTITDSTGYHWPAWRDTLADERNVITYEMFVADFGKRREIAWWTFGKPACRNFTAAPASGQRAVAPSMVGYPHRARLGFFLAPSGLSPLRRQSSRPRVGHPRTACTKL